MKRLIELSAIFFVLLTLVSCQVDLKEGVDHPVLIDGRTFPGDNSIWDHGIDKASGSIWYRFRPVRFDDPYFDNGNLYHSVWNSKLNESATPAEAFAFERILSRTAPVKEEFLLYRRELLNDGKLAHREDSALVSITFANTYVAGLPTVVAEGILFGQEPGTDLSEWFRVKDNNIIGIIGRNYTIERRADLVDKYLDFSEYFVVDRMLPIGLDFNTESIPEEISTDDFGLIRYDGHYSGDTIIKVTVTIPVIFEHYWDWCEALYSNPDAQEVFHEGSLTYMIPLVKKK